MFHFQNKIIFGYELKKRQFLVVVVVSPIYKSTSKVYLDLERLNCYYTNATSLRCKINEIRLLASTSKAHIMSINETWFAESSSVCISDYNVFRRDRASHAGGVCIYLSCDLDTCEIIDVVLTDSAVEQVWCAIKICNQRILIGCIYIPDPNAENIAMFNSLTRVDRLMNSLNSLILV